MQPEGNQPEGKHDEEEDAEAVSDPYLDVDEEEGNAGDPDGGNAGDPGGGKRGGRGLPLLIEV